MPNLLGTAPNQVPTNADLGTMAFQDAKSVNIAGGKAALSDVTGANIYQDTAISDTKPSLLLDFANSKTLDPRITYTRASTASYYDGKTTAVAEQNLVTYSQDFSNALWSKNATTITTNATAAPDGSTTADTITASAGAAYHYVFGSGSASSGNFVFSVYVKKSTTDFVSVNVCDGSSGSRYAAATFNLTTVASTQNAVLGTGISITSASIVSVGGSWYRLILTGSSTTYPMNTVFVSLNSSGTPTYNTGFYGLETWTAAGTEAAYLWGAQLEQRSSVSSYTPTTSSAITNYIPALQTALAGVPRFDCNPVTGESLGLLIEEQRTNLMLQSQFASGWAATRLTLSTNQIVAPDGTLTGAKIIDDTSANSHYIYNTASLTNGVAYTFTFYAKAGGRDWATLWLTSLGTLSNTYFDLQNGVLGTVGTGVTASITSVGNGWYRCSVTGTSTSTGTTAYIGTATANNTNTAAGDGYSGLYIWGAQLEAGSFATSYIPTTSAQVTRSADAASMTGTNFSSWFNQAEGTLYAESNFSSLANPYPAIAFVGDGSNSYVGVAGSGANSGSLAGLCVVNNVTQASLTLSNSVTANANVKLAMAYKPNSFSAYTANISGSSSSGSLPSVTAFYIGKYSGYAYINGTIKKLACYPKRLSDAELQEMTL